MLIKSYIFSALWGNILALSFSLFRPTGLDPTFQTLLFRGSRFGARDQLVLNSYTIKNILAKLFRNITKPILIHRFLMWIITLLWWTLYIFIIDVNKNYFLGSSAAEESFKIKSPESNNFQDSIAEPH